MEQSSMADILFRHLEEYVKGLNKMSAEQNIPNVYSIEIKGSGKPLQSGGSVIKHYRTLELTLNDGKSKFLLYQAHSPIKNEIEANKNKTWLIQLTRDLNYQMFTNYCVMAHASILERERKLRPQVKKVGSMVGLDGKPLTMEQPLTPDEAHSKSDNKAKMEIKK